MKAKEYAEKYQQDRTSLRGILADFVTEARDLILSRRCRTDAATIAVLEEQDRKFAAFARKTGEIREDGFQTVIAELMPGIALAWATYRRELREKRGGL